MPVLVMALVALAAFLLIGGLLFAAGICEREELEHEQTGKPAQPAA